MIAEPDPADPGHRRGRLRDPPLRGARHRGNPIVKVLLYPGLLVQMITTQAADRRHDRGRDRLDGGGARRRRRADPGRLRRASSSDPMRLGRRAGRPATPAPIPSAPSAESAAPVTLDPPHPGMTVAMAASDLDAKLAEVARQYDDVQAELVAARDLARPRRDPPARPASCRGSSRSSRRSAASRRPGRELAGARELRDAGDADDELRDDGARRDRPARGRRDAPARGAARSCCCRATRTTTAT